MDLSELVATPGIGVRYLSPVGPIRIDAGFNLAGSEAIFSDRVMIRAFADARSFDLEYAPGVRREETNQYNVIVEPLLFDVGVYPLTHVDGWHAVESVSAAISAYYGAPTGEDAYNTAKKPVFEELAEARAKVGAKLASLQRSMTDESEREARRASGA